MKRKELGLNDPLLVRYGHYMINMLHGDLGTSYKNNLSVWSQVMGAVSQHNGAGSGRYPGSHSDWNSTGIISAKKQYSLMDNTAMLLSLIGGHA